MINSTIEQYRKRHEQVLETIIHDSNIPAPLIKEAMHYALFPGGKRIRPILVYLTGSLLRVDIDCLDTIAAAIEITHCYSLIHDDLPAMDNDDMRRGKLSCHRAFDEATAILTGDGMQALAVELLLTQLSPLLPPEKITAITTELVKASGVSGMVSGQSLDLSELGHSLVTDAQLRQIHGLKTGCLISACINMVLHAQTTSHEKARALQQFASLLGLVFQLQDDYLDHFSTKDVLGKGRASDKANQKTTFASLYSQSELLTQITELYQQAYAALDEFEHHDEGLYAFVKQLEIRHQA